jgi:hypothetical protein
VASLAEQTDLQTAIAKRVFGGLRSLDWTTAEMFWSGINGMTTGWVITRDSQGGKGHPDPRQRVIDHHALMALKEAMAAPGTGTWLSTTMSLTAQGRFTFTFNYDRRVYWNTPELTPFEAPEFESLPTDQDWLDEFEKHPRSPEHLPAFVAELKPAVPLEVNQDVLRRALDAPVTLPASHAALAGADGWGDVLMVIADAAKRRFRAGEYPELLQSPYSQDWHRSEDALMEDVYGDAVDVILPEGVDGRVSRLYASLRSAGIGADANGDPKLMRDEVDSAIDRLVQADVVSRLKAIGAE